MVWTFDFGTGQWQNMAPSGPEIDAYCEAKAIYDPQTEQVYFHAHGWYEYDFASNTLVEKPSFNNWGGVSIALDPVHRIVVEIGSGDAYLFDLDLEDRAGADLPTTGVEVVRDEQNPGLDYDAELGRIVAWAGGPDVYSFDAETMEWEVHPPADTNSIVPSEVTASGGTYGRFAYSPGKNVYVLLNKADENVYLYRLAPGAGNAGSRPGHHRYGRVRGRLERRRWGRHDRRLGRGVQRRRADPIGRHVFAGSDIGDERRGTNGSRRGRRRRRRLQLPSVRVGLGGGRCGDSWWSPTCRRWAC